MYEKKFSVLIFYFALFLSFNVFFSFEIEKSVNLTNISSFDVENYIYVSTLDSEKIFKYSPALTNVDKLNVYRRFLRDIELEQGSVYALQYLGLFRLYPTTSSLAEEIGGAFSFIKKGDFFYIAHYNGKLSKWKMKTFDVELLKEVREYFNKPLPKLNSITSTSNYIVVSFEEGVIFFDYDLNAINEFSLSFLESLFGEIGRIKAVNFYDGFLIITAENAIVFTTPDFEYFVVEENNLELKEVKLSPLGLYGISDNVLYKLDYEIETPLQIISSLRKNLTLSLKEVRELDLLMENESYGMAIKFLNNIPKEEEVIPPKPEPKQQEEFIPKEPEERDLINLISFVFIALLITLFLAIGVFWIIYKKFKGEDGTGGSRFKFSKERNKKR